MKVNCRSLNIPTLGGMYTDIALALMTERHPPQPCTQPLRLHCVSTSIGSSLHHIIHPICSITHSLFISLPVHKVAPAEGKRVLLGGTASHLDHWSSCSTLLTEACCLLWSEGKQRVFHHKVVLESLTEGEVGTGGCVGGDGAML